MQLLTDFKINLVSGLRLTLFKTTQSTDFTYSLNQFALLLALELLLAIATSYFLHLPKPRFLTWGLTGYSFALMCFFIIAYLMALMLKRSEAFLELCVVCHCISPLLIVVLFIPNWLAHSSEIAFHKPANWLAHILSIYLWIIYWRAISLVAKRSKRITITIFLLLFLASSANQILFRHDVEFWYSSEKVDDEEEDADYAAYEKLDAENLMYSQVDVLNKQLAKIQPQRSKKIDIFYMGFAGYAMEDVFYKEVTFIKQLMDSRFDTSGHSINLINNLKTISEIPLATATNLRLALKRFGQAMDADDDVLLLYLTSHGSKDHRLTVDFYPLALNDVTPESLKNMLDEAGIKWRILIISSCYSGGFVNLLASPTTLIATSVASNNKSFGCGTHSDFTYFGQALFQEQLNHQASMVTALNNAVDSIKKRELKEKQKFSNPQVSVGADIANKLKSLDVEPHRYQCSLVNAQLADC